MKSKFVEVLMGWLERVGLFSFGYLKGRMDAKKKLKDDNDHINSLFD